MPIEKFPPIEQADENGLLAFGGDLDVQSLLLAYKSGIFPWPISQDFPMAWFSPNPRGILNPAKIIISKSLRKVFKQKKFKITFNLNFDEIIQTCSNRHLNLDQKGTWITPEIIKAYNNLFEAGYAYSVEVRDYKTHKIVGGLYGVQIGDLYTGESMFYLQSNASKVALCAILSIIKKNHLPWLDTQMVSPIVKKLGGEEISRKQYLKELQNLIIADKTNMRLSRYNDSEINELIIENLSLQ